MRSANGHKNRVDWEVIHGPYLPASVYLGMGVTARPRGLGAQAIDLRIWRLSPQGIEFVRPEGLDIELGQPLSFELTLAQQTVPYVGVVVSPEHIDDKVTLVGVKFEPQKRQAPELGPGTDARTYQRFTADKRFYPTGIAYSPLTFHDTILFTVQDVSTEGLRLCTSMRNKFLLPGLRLSAQIHFPPMASSSIQFEIRNISVVTEGGKYFQAIGAAIVEHDTSFKAAMGQYILQFGGGKHPPTPKQVTEQKLEADETANIIDWVFAETVQDFKQVAALKLLAHPNETRENTLKGMTFDDRSRVLIGRFRGEVVASLRLIFCSLEDDLFEVEHYASLPAKYRHRLATAEPSLLTVHPDFQATDLPLDLIRFVLFVILQSGRKWALHASSPEMVPFLAKLGFTDTGIRLDNQAGGRAHWHVLWADVEAIVEGRSVGPVMWNKLFHGREEHLHHQHWRKTGKLGTMRLATYRMLEPASSIMEKIARKSR